MDSKFDGPDLYAVVGTGALELVEVSEEVKDKVSRTLLLSEFKSRETDTTTKINQEINVFKKQLKTNFQRELDEMKIDYESQIKQVRSGWVGAFGNMKKAFKDVITD